MGHNSGIADNIIIAKKYSLARPSLSGYLGKYTYSVASTCDHGNCRCQDYVTIDAGAGGSMEYCGNVVPPNPFIVGTGIHKGQ